MGTYEFRQARAIDLADMADLEKEFFSGFSMAYDLAFMEKWFVRFPELFFVVEDNKRGGISAFTIVVPVDEGMYTRLKKGEISDLYDFAFTDVSVKESAPYRFVADICVGRRETGGEYMAAAVTLLRGLFAFIAETGARYVLTSPVTDDGNRVCRQMGFRKISEKELDGTSYPICELLVTEKLRKKYARKKDTSHAPCRF